VKSPPNYGQEHLQKKSQDLKQKSIQQNMQTNGDIFFVSKLKNGDEAAFREAVQLYRNKVYNTALGILQHQEDAEDITQEVFIELFRSVSGFRGEASLSTWIYRLAVQKSLEHYRNSKRKKRSGLIQRLFGQSSQVEIPATDIFYHPGISLENRERSAILFRAIDCLPENQKIAFVLHKVEGLSQTEISQVMNTTISAVESLIFRAKQSLRELLSDYYEKNER
jgi:RNA polymerase sigma-70 factor (ECF subfamily)